MSPEEIRSKGLFLVSNFSPLSQKSLWNKPGVASEHALSVVKYGETPPKNYQDTNALYKKGLNLLDNFATMTEENNQSTTESTESIQPESAVAKYSQAYVIEDTDLALNKLSNGLVRVPIARIGEWQHDSYGPVKFTQTDFEQIKQNHQNNVLGFESYLTYGHPKDSDNKDAAQNYLEEAQAFDAERKRGDLQNVVFENNVLYGDFNPKSETVKAVENGEYEYSSGEFIHDFTDKNTGENVGTVLVRTALTNAPFIPLGEKVRVLSQTAEVPVKENQEKNKQNPHSTLNFIIKLSTEHSLLNNIKPTDSVVEESDSINTNLNNKLTTNTLETTTASQPEAEVQQKEVMPVAPASTASAAPIANVPASTNQEVVNQIVSEATQEKIAPEAVTKTEEDKASIDVESLLAKIKKEFSEQLAAAKSGYEDVINGLKTQVQDLTNQVTEQKQISYKFSQNLSQQEQTAKAKELSDAGVSPALIQRYSMLANSINTQGQNTVLKFSTTVEGKEQEVESPLLKEVESLLVDAVKSEPVMVEKFGQTTATQSTFAEGFQSIIAKNQEKAQKLKAQ